MKYCSNCGKELKNDDLWKELDEQLSRHNVTFIKVKGHSDCELNNLVAKLLNDEEYQDQIAWAIYVGIQKYFSETN